MGVFSRNKGNREERAIVNLHKQHGFEAKRVPLSGAADGFKGDLIVHGLVGEAKLRATGFRTIYSWLGDNDFLTIRNDKSERLYVIREDRWIAMLKDHVRPRPPEDFEQIARESGL
jgi:hypothetical protein